jgi:alkanesulfonate monooxygenase SsuD/methylene tetrahydromethanopterin reductase-like flavin-dependent oxidoreductase (luciferase family)
MAAIPDALIDMVTLAGPPDVVRDRLRAYRDAGVGTVSVALPPGLPEEAITQQLRLVAELAEAS